MPKSRKFIYMMLGVAGYARDRLKELQRELVERGEESAEDIRDFWDDIIENVSATTAQKQESEKELAKTEEKSGIVGLWTAFDIKEAVADFMDEMGLAKPRDIKEIQEQLDRIGRAIENLS